jgi:hypothetical protein
MKTKIIKKMIMFAITFVLAFNICSITAFANTPDFTGKTISELETYANENNIPINYRYEYRDTVQKDIIVSQTNNENEIIALISLGKENTDGVIIHNPEVSTNQSNSFGIAQHNINIDGNFDDWDGLPISYHFNWDNSENCWYHGVWHGGTNYMTPVGTYDNHVRHGMQMYSDGEYVYVHIKIATVYTTLFNGNDYQFTIDGEKASFQLETLDGDTLQNGFLLPVGLTQVTIRHRDAAQSYVVDGSSLGFIKVNEDKLNTEVEFKIPISAMKEQNNNINIENIGTIEFFTPNLMYQSMVCSGTSSGPILFAIISIVAFSGGLFIAHKNKKGKKDGV